MTSVEAATLRELICLRGAEDGAEDGSEVSDNYSEPDVESALSIPRAIQTSNFFSFFVRVSKDYIPKP
jgi:hypothetical protein